MTICPTCGCDTLPPCADSETGKVPVERLREGDFVRAVRNGPKGRVVDPDRAGWTIVRWPKGAVLPYEHGKDQLILLTNQRS